MINFLHTYIPNSKILEFSYLSIHWYGVMIALGAVIGLLVVVKLAKYYNIKTVLIYDFIFYAIIVSIFSARIYYIFYNWQYYSYNFNSIYKIWEGGLAIHGAMIGGVIVLLLFVKKHDIDFWKFLDILVIGFVIGQIFGRWGNYFNQELFGIPTNLPWGIPIQSQFRPEHYLYSQYFHPTFLYEMVLNVMLLGVLLLLHKYNLKKKSFQTGTIALIYFIGYSLIRIFTETLRIDYTPLLFGIRWAQIISSIIIILSFVIIFYKQKRIK